MADQDSVISSRWRECSQCHLRHPIEAQSLSGCCEALLVTVVSELPRDTRHWSVVVERNGERIVTLESNSLSGRDLSDEDERVIRMAADHLHAFVGRPRKEA